MSHPVLVWPCITSFDCLVFSFFFFDDMFINLDFNQCKSLVQICSATRVPLSSVYILLVFCFSCQ